MRGLVGQVGLRVFKNLGHRQNAVAVQIALHRKVHHVAIASPRHDHRALQRQGQHFFEHTRHLTQLRPGRSQRFTGFDANLAFAVIAHARGLQNARQQVLLDLGQGGLVVQHGIGRTGHATRHKMGLFAGPVLGHRHAGRCGRDHAGLFNQSRQAGGRYIFKFGGHGGAEPAQLGQGLRVAVIGHQVLVADASRRAVGIGVQDHREIAHLLGGMHKHAAQLAAAQHPQRGTGQDDGAALHAWAGGRVMARAAWVWAKR